MVLAKNNDKPLTLNASTIAIGISIIIVLSCSIKTFFTAGSNNHAIAAVPPATQKDKKSAKFQKELKTKIKSLQKYIEKNCDNVGNKFAQEARKIHYDDKRSRGIYGTASSDQMKELTEEGIEVSSIPWIEKKEH